MLKRRLRNQNSGVLNQKSGTGNQRHAICLDVWAIGDGVPATCGYYEKTTAGVNSLNNITAKTNGDGSVTIRFGGCDDKIANCLQIMEGWNYMVRLYRPRAEILDGRWVFPEARVLRE